MVTDKVKVAQTETNTSVDLQQFIAGLFPFNYLPLNILENLLNKVQLFRYRMGQLIVAREAMPEQIIIIYEGQARLLGYEFGKANPATLKLLSAGEVLGWVSHVRGVACETAIASSEVITINLPVADFLALMQQESAFAQALYQTASLIEVYELLQAELHRCADGSQNLVKLTQAVNPNAIAKTITTRQASPQLDSEYLWLISGSSSAEFPVGSCLESEYLNPKLKFPAPMRLLGLPKTLLGKQPAPKLAKLTPIAYAPEINITPEPAASDNKQKYPCVRGRGPLDASLACFQMLSQYFNIPFRKDTVRRVLTKQQTQTGSISLQYCGAVAELIGLTTQMVKVPASAVSRLQAPVMISWQDSFAIIYKNSNQELLIAVPEMGLLRRKAKDFAETWGEEGEVLLLQPTKNTPKARFSLQWFVPALRRYRKVLTEVLVASIVIQVFGLVNPLVTQVIIDKVIVGNSPDTLEVFGIFLLVVAVAEAVLTNLRTHLFTDTTNRIDLSLGSEVINHLLRLPLSYFECRPVGELATRIHELENIRSFLTGTALTVVMDAVFSVVYILVMAIYSPALTLVALATIPMFALLNLMVSPLMRRQLQQKAERNAETQSYLVEIMGEMQTVKAQNLEMRSRWQWQERYARYISAGFKTVSTQTTVGSISNFLNKLSSMLVLWVGAYLVLNHQLTLGQLIAFRILAGYVSSPLLRLVQLWQNFQETALSLQRLADILDTPQETETDSQNILMPSIQGSVRYENLSFSFRENGPLQLCNINLDFPAGSFVGIVGQSGSGKSTLLKLLPRLYEPKSGKILIDGYDISKVELYSLRTQIGMVLQDTLLFDGTVRENIALACPDASDEEIIAAAKVAFAHDFIMSLPSGYNTRVGERGSALSGGQRQRVAIAQSREKSRNTAALSQEDLLAKITANDQTIAEIDSQLTKMIVDNTKRLYEINSQIGDLDSKLTQAQETLKYQQLKSPVDGIVFELKAKAPGFVVNPSEPILKVVPSGSLVANVYITNRDIGFVKAGQTVDVRIDSFPFQEYGDIQGELVEIGSDALPPDQVYQFWRFAAKVRLDGQTLLINQRQVPLQSGMSVNANIKLRQRTVMSIFTDFLVQKAESLKSVR
ncbi:ABC-type bacteriocin/lantibiotic exporter with N-terminal double-glycine peptidase domain [Cylindrospermum stagnale PCC 7417]|uniref:ABC-type bacteriocin/lantibiotic exporter with N-terminal double-glycine peptidase domain n=1 Tax=Cylindrospermum stagnale PCC 7417 TaxID=56107 RepID=K9WSD6_9NOST|nr:ABC transporter transmembrane domain-containing protein [Cylindrospermum stagnale]AFZ23103.1 ABC-type bacteriocin/lantibiotic exporter with N-terminal double-glycine peptidase domain [Cylindrospermum stagnale PCC 7417]